MGTPSARRAALTLASAALVIGGLAGCGGSDSAGGSAGGSGGGSGAGAPADASKTDFCQAFSSMITDAGTTSGDVSSQVEAIKADAAKLADVGTPAEMPDDARHGFEVFVGSIERIDDDASLSDLSSLGNDFSGGDEKDGAAFITWTTTNCPAALSDLPSAGSS